MTARSESLWIVLAAVLNELEANGEVPNAREAIWATNKGKFLVEWDAQSGRWEAFYRRNMKMILNPCFGGGFLLPLGGPVKSPDDPLTPPHCDQSILHAPGQCQACDLYPEWQRLRDVWRINFTGEYDTDKAPCPSVYFRQAGDRDAWGGNVPWNPDAP